MVHDDLSEDHSHGPANYNTAFALGVAMNLAFVLVEAGCGVASGSLALLADAGHNLGDVAGLLLAWGAAALSRRRPSRRHTYGLRRTTILAALANAALLLVAVGAIAWEAILRFAHPAPVAGGTVMAVAGVGIIVNGATALLFTAGRKKDLNVEGAFLHMAADAAVSLGVLVAGAAISLTGWAWLDSVMSLVVAAVVSGGTWGLLRRSVDLAVDAVPEHIDPDEVRTFLAELPGVTTVHDLHIWGMSTTEAALTAHVVRPQAGADDAFLALAARELHDRFGIEHVTLQVERGDAAQQCRLEPDDVV